MSFQSNKTKVQLKLALNRLKLTQQKKTSLNQQARKDVAQLLANNKSESARIRVENVIREDLLVEALELLELYTETLLARFPLLESMRHCDPAISESVNTLIYASPRVDIPELLQVFVFLLTIRSVINYSQSLARNSGLAPWRIKTRSLMRGCEECFFFNLFR